MDTSLDCAHMPPDRYSPVLLSNSKLAQSGTPVSFFLHFFAFIQTPRVPSPIKGARVARLYEITHYKWADI